MTDRFFVAFEKAIAECKLMSANPNGSANKEFYLGVAAAVDTLEIFLAKEASRQINHTALARSAFRDYKQTQRENRKWPPAVRTAFFSGYLAAYDTPDAEPREAGND